MTHHTKPAGPASTGPGHPQGDHVTTTIASKILRTEFPDLAALVDQGVLTRSDALGAAARRRENSKLALNKDADTSHRAALLVKLLSYPDTSLTAVQEDEGLHVWITVGTGKTVRRKRTPIKTVRRNDETELWEVKDQ